VRGEQTNGTMTAFEKTIAPRRAAVARSHQDEAW
jgi:hypothetical protein